MSKIVGNVITISSLTSYHVTFHSPRPIKSNFTLSHHSPY